jgi:hypothetical protein
MREISSPVDTIAIDRVKPGSGGYSCLLAHCGERQLEEHVFQCFGPCFPKLALLGSGPAYLGATARYQPSRIIRGPFARTPRRAAPALALA